MGILGKKYVWWSIFWSLFLRNISFAAVVRQLGGFWVRSTALGYTSSQAIKFWFEEEMSHTL